MYNDKVSLYPSIRSGQFFGESEERAFSTPPRRLFYHEVPGYGRSARLLPGAGSFKDMAVTFPPVGEVILMTDTRWIAFRSHMWKTKHVYADREGTGVQFGKLLSIAAELADLQGRMFRYDHSETDKDAVQVIGGEMWQLCPKSVDEITGWEMLRLMDVGVKAFRQEMVC